jgi:multimeric flavodoxin WrbA
MKVIILNGSPKTNGNTATALHEVERILQQQGIETEWIHVGHLQIHGCIACNKCWTTGICAFSDIVNEISAKMRRGCDACHRYGNQKSSHGFICLVECCFCFQWQMV